MIVLATRIRALMIRIRVPIIAIIARALNIPRKVRTIAISGITGGREPLAVRRTSHAPHRWLQRTPRSMRQPPAPFSPQRKPSSNRCSTPRWGDAPRHAERLAHEAHVRVPSRVHQRRDVVLHLEAVTGASGAADCCSGATTHARGRAACMGRLRRCYSITRPAARCRCAAPSPPSVRPPLLRRTNALLGFGAIAVQRRLGFAMQCKRCSFFGGGG